MCGEFMVLKVHCECFQTTSSTELFGCEESSVMFSVSVSPTALVAWFVQCDAQAKG